MTGKAAQTTLQAAITVVCFAYSVTLYSLGVGVSDGPKRLVAYLPGALGILLIVFDRWAWRWWCVNWLVGRPIVEGAWLGALQPSPQSRIPTSGNRGPIEAAMVIEQTFFAVHVTLYTRESASQSSGGMICSIGDSSKQKSLRYFYGNEARAEHRHRSPNHEGAAALSIVGDKPQALQGAYWTSRITGGDIEMHLVSRDVDFSTLDQVKTAAAAKASPKG